MQQSEAAESMTGF
jgi:hypothetical protein